MRDTPLTMIQQRMAKPVDAEELEMMGKRAAALYSDTMPLNDAVVSVIKEACYSPEQIKRVCEFANVATYHQELAKCGEMRNVTFESGPASPSYVTNELNNGASPAIHHVSCGDYDGPMASSNDDDRDAVFEAAFGSIKEASVSPLQHHDPIEDVIDLKQRLDSVYDEGISKKASVDVHLGDSTERMVKEAAAEIMKGIPVSAVANVIYDQMDNEICKIAFTALEDHLRGRGIEGDITTQDDGGIVDPTHPLVIAAQDFSKVASYSRALNNVLADVDTNRRVVKDGLLDMTKSAGVLSKARDIGLNTVKAGWRAARAGADAAGGSLVSSGAPAFVGDVVKLAPHIGVGVGAYKAYDSDTVRNLKYRYALWKYNRAQRAAAQRAALQRGFQ